MATLKDVAKYANVSLATASYALNNDTRIKKETRDKVHEAVQKLNYVPNGSARNLRQKKYHRIIVFVSNFGGPIYQEILEYLYEKLKAVQYEMLVCNGGSAKNFLNEKNYDGIINFDATIETSVLAQASNYSYPIVDTTRNWKEDKIIALPLRGIQPVYEIINLALEEGYKTFGYIHGSLDSYDNSHRFKGFKKALENKGISPSLILYGNFTSSSGYDAMKDYLKQEKTLPEVLFFANDEMALGAIDYLKKVHYDLSSVKIIGFDNIQLSEFYVPSLTTIAIDRDYWTTAIVNKIIGLIEGKKVDDYLCKYQIIRRQTF